MSEAITRFPIPGDETSQELSLPGDRPVIMPDGRAIGSPMQRGDVIVAVRDTRLYAALLVMDVPLRQDPPYNQVKLKSGQIVVDWCFYPQSIDGKYNTVDLCRWWKEGLPWVLANKTHPWAQHVAAKENYHQAVEHLRADKPFVLFTSEDGGMNIMVKEGSAKYQLCIEKGLKQL